VYVTGRDVHVCTCMFRPDEQLECGTGNPDSCAKDQNLHAMQPIKCHVTDEGPEVVAAMSENGAVGIDYWRGTEPHMT
jgi:hypothetical protein